MKRYIQYTSSVLALLLIGACFLPWTHYNSLNVTFNGFNVEPFPTGNYYGKAGRFISFSAGFIFVLSLLPYIWSKRLALFTAAVVFAYTVRTFIIFTSALFKGEVEKYAGIYLIIIISFLLMIAVALQRKRKENV